MGKTKLTDKQALFCKEYIIDFNGTRAAKAAGYSVKTATAAAHDTLTKLYIQDEIKRLTQKRNKKVEVSAERVVEELARIGFSNEDNLEGFTRLQMSDKLKAMEMLARHTGTFNNDESGKAVINVTVGKKKP